MTPNLRMLLNTENMSIPSFMPQEAMLLLLTIVVVNAVLLFVSFYNFIINDIYYLLFLLCLPSSYTSLVCWQHKRLHLLTYTLFPFLFLIFLFPFFYLVLKIFFESISTFYNRPVYKSTGSFFSWLDVLIDRFFCKQPVFDRLAQFSIVRLSFKFSKFAPLM